LIHDAAISVAVIRAAVALLDQRPCLLFFLLFGIDELLDVAVPITQRVHLCRPSSLAAGLYDIGNLVVYFEEGQRAAGTATAAQLLFARADRRQIGPRARPVLEEHRLAIGEVHDAFHIVVHRLNETGAPLRILILGGGALCDVGLPVVKPIPARR